MAARTPGGGRVPGVGLGARLQPRWRRRQAALSQCLRSHARGPVLRVGGWPRRTTARRGGCRRRVAVRRDARRLHRRVYLVGRHDHLCGRVHLVGRLLRLPGRHDRAWRGRACHRRRSGWSHQCQAAQQRHQGGHRRAAGAARGDGGADRCVGARRACRSGRLRRRVLRLRRARGLARAYHLLRRRVHAPRRRHGVRGRRCDGWQRGRSRDREEGGCGRLGRQRHAGVQRRLLPGEPHPAPRDATPEAVGALGRAAELRWLLLRRRHRVWRMDGRLRQPLARRQRIVGRGQPRRQPPRRVGTALPGVRLQPPAREQGLHRRQQQQRRRGQRAARLPGHHASLPGRWALALAARGVRRWRRTLAGRGHGLLPPPPPRTRQ